MPSTSTAMRPSSAVLTNADLMVRRPCVSVADLPALTARTVPQSSDAIPRTYCPTACGVPKIEPPRVPRLLTLTGRPADRRCVPHMHAMCVVDATQRDPVRGHERLFRRPGPGPLRGSAGAAG